MPRENLDHSRNGRRSPPVVASETACLELGQELTCFVRDEIVRRIPTKKRFLAISFSRRAGRQKAHLLLTVSIYS